MSHSRFVSQEARHGLCAARWSERAGGPNANYPAVMELTVKEVRVLGCLIEKGATTPDHYPLSTNALVNACNQRSNREPVVEYSEQEAVAAMVLVRQNGLARTNGSGRSDKHRHILIDALGIDLDQQALLAVMMLRGPQSSGELKTRTDRYATSQGSGFESPDDIEAVLTAMADKADPYVANIGRGPGQSQDRWAHLFGETVPDVNDLGTPPTPATPATPASPSLAQRVESLEARLAVLEEALGMPAATSYPAQDD